MRLSPEHRVAILLHDGIRGSQGKTGLSLLRYSDANIVAVIDQQCAGESLPELTGIPCSAPIVASVADSLPYKPDAISSRSRQKSSATAGRPKPSPRGPSRIVSGSKTVATKPLRI